VSLLPTRRTHLKFDKYLAEHGIVAYRDYSVVHDRMDRLIRKYGSAHRMLDEYHREEGIRYLWLKKWQHLAYQDTLTDYLRVALGHLVLDDIASRYWYNNEYELIKSAYRSYIQRGFDRCFFRET
jgi:hypothetical protein